IGFGSTPARLMCDGATDERTKCPFAQRSTTRISAVVTGAPQLQVLTGRIGPGQAACVRETAGGRDERMRRAVASGRARTMAARDRARSPDACLGDHGVVREWTSVDLA